MRLLLALVGAASLVAVGWICWRATAETREWREFVALGTNPNPTQAERNRFVLLGERLFPQERPYRPQNVTLLNALPDRRILVLFHWRDRCGDTGASLCVLDEEGRRRSSSHVPAGACGVACRPSPGRGPSAFDVAQLTPVGEIVHSYVLVNDRPVLVPLGEN